MTQTVQNKTIAVFGGSFNPPTLSHTRIVERLLHSMDEVWVLPVFNPPHKSNLVAFHHRVEMLDKALSHLDNVYVSDFEKQLSISNFRQGNDSVNYTAHTLKALEKQYPDYKFVYACGPDVNLSTYKDHHLIEHTFVVDNHYKERSSLFRYSLEKNNYKRAKDCVSHNVWDYITAFKIYDPKIVVDKDVVYQGYIPHINLSIYYNDNGFCYDNVEQFEQHYNREVIQPKDSIGITLFDPDNRKLLIKREKRFGPFINEGALFQYGVVEGTMEKDEDPVFCAQREVEEETGLNLDSDNIKLINRWYPSAGYMSEIKHVLVGTFSMADYQQLNTKQGLDDENEEIFTEIFDLDELMLWHTTPNGAVFSPEISAALLYIQFQYFTNNKQ